LTERDKFSAAPAAAGYLYQARLALALCLRHVNGDASIEVGVEALDDVSFVSNGTPIELLQAKHHLERIASLTDHSADLWKTLRVWSVAVAKDPTIPGRTRLALVTTGHAPEGSVASLLRPPQAYPTGSTRDPKSAAETLAGIAIAGGNKELSQAYTAFLALTPSMRASLLSAIEILDDQPLVTDLAGVVEEQLRVFAPRGKASLAREMLEGWWWGRVCDALVQTPLGLISVLEIEVKLDDIRELLKREALIAEFAEAEPSEADIASYEGRPFVRQLEIVGVSPQRMEWAKRDYYRAFTQRSRWVRDHLLFDGEIARFEKRLVEEWQPRFQQMADANTDGTPATLQREGHAIYAWVETEARFPFRTDTHRFLTVGSYHILANELRVGWHREYANLCAMEPA